MFKLFKNFNREESDFITEYNDKQYCTSSSLTVPGLITENTTITYDCK